MKESDTITNIPTTTSTSPSSGSGAAAAAGDNGSHTRRGKHTF